VAVVGWTRLGAEVLGRLPELRMVSAWATGSDPIDVRAAARLGITVSNVPDYAGPAVSELTIGLMLSLCRNVAPGNRRVREGNLSWQGLDGIELAGRTLGLVGVGSIGARVARVAQALGMRVTANARTMSGERAARLGVEFRPLDEVLAGSDIVSLHLPLTAESAGLISEERLALLKPGAVLVNTSRAGLVDQQALYEALVSRRLAGAALDDLDPTRPDIAALDNVLATPHIGFLTDAALRRKGDICVTNVESFLRGEPRNVVTPPPTADA
jgi:D-3-phosphoglycerate dehydrogenase